MTSKTVKLLSCNIRNFSSKEANVYALAFLCSKNSILNFQNNTINQEDYEKPFFKY